MSRFHVPPHPQWDGSYIDEIGNQHETWTIESDSTDQLYVIDINRKTGEVYCTCKGHADYSRGCKHISRLFGQWSIGDIRWLLGEVSPQPV